MLPNHYMDVSLGPDDGTLAYFSRVPVGTVIVFVHGLNGHAIDTWERMHELLPSEAAAAGVDIVFYGYQSMKSQALMSANLLRQFISDLNNPNSAVCQLAPRERRAAYPRLVYKKILLVGHSLGGALARRVMLDALKLKEAWAKRTRLVLFAPAHCGTFLAELKKEIRGTSKIISVFAALLDLNVPVLTDLEPDSSFIKSLREETLIQLKRHPKAPLKAEVVIFGQFEKIVAGQNFCDDPPSVSWPRQNHTSVCKANQTFRDPLTEILIRL
jgi:pimeloyl-ACP methyl ester carboxylesterase